MIRINLMPRAEARRQAARQRDKQVTALIVAGLVAIVGAGEVVTRRDAAGVQEEADRYQAELADLSKRHQEATLLDKKRAQLRAKLATIDVLERQRRGPVHVLDDLSSATPEKLWLTEIKETGGTMTLIGKGLDNQTIAQFMRKLAGSPYFESVDLVETKQIEEGQAKLKQFTISARVNYAGRASASAPAPAEEADRGAGGNASAPAASAAAEEAARPAGGSAAAPSSGGGTSSGAGAGSAGPLGSLVAAPEAARGAAAVAEARGAAQERAAGLGRDAAGAGTGP